MRFLVLIAAFASTLIAGQAAAQATSYTFTSGLYDTISNSAACTIGECTTFTAAQRATVTLTYASPLAPNLPFAEYSAGVIAYRFSDGVRTTTGPSANAALYRAEFATNASGVPTQVIMTVERTPGPPYPILDPADPNAYVSYINFLLGASQAVSNTVCSRRGPGFNAAPGPGACSADGGSPQSSSASHSAPPVVTVASASVVPTMTEWAMILFGLTLAGAAAVVIRRRRTA